MGNQITSFFGQPHESFLASLRKAKKRREKRALVAKAITSINRLIRLRNKETALLGNSRRACAISTTPWPTASTGSWPRTSWGIGDPR